jgi:glycosyltransferase involved in cell wall biosynthesis
MARQGGRLRVAMIGTRGVPAAYGGFETAVDEIGRRMAADGVDVTVYCRTRKGAPRPAEYAGMRLVHLPALHSKTLETLSHTGLSVLHALFRRRYDAAFVFNAANSPFLPVLRLARVPVAVHVDGLEWKRGKWGRLGRRYYRIAESLSVRWGDALIADAQGIADYYTEEFGVETRLLTYGAKAIEAAPGDALASLGLEPGGYHLAVARFEPENHVDVIVDGSRRSGARLPLVVVGSAPYAAEYSQRIAADLEAGDPEEHWLGLPQAARRRVDRVEK